MPTRFFVSPNFRFRLPENIQISDEAEQIRLTGKTAEQTQAEVYTGTTTETAARCSGSLNNVFDKKAVQNELDLQRTVSQSFNQNIQAACVVRMALKFTRCMRKATLSLIVPCFNQSPP